MGLGGYVPGERTGTVLLIHSSEHNEVDFVRRERARGRRPCVTPHLHASTERAARLLDRAKL